MPCGLKMVRQHHASVWQLVLELWNVGHWDDATNISLLSKYLMNIMDTPAWYSYLNYTFIRFIKKILTGYKVTSKSPLDSPCDSCASPSFCRSQLTLKSSAGGFALMMHSIVTSVWWSSAVYEFSQNISGMPVTW